MDLLLAYYGDDFTGSTDVMEVLQWSGLRTVLFLDPPAPQQLAAFENLRAYGVAGWSRTMSPAEMEQELKPALASLQASGAEIVHYKTCSTADSSPQIGSLGKALEIGREVCGSACVPILIAAPNLGRYQVFGNLFARSGLDTEPSRLDRHPTMRQHPITPMQEADMREHFRQQTTLDIALYDCLKIDAANVARRSASVSNAHDRPKVDTLAAITAVTATAADARAQSLELPRADAVLFDALYEHHLPIVGSLLDRIKVSGQTQFVFGSSGVESALTAFWEQSGQMATLRSHAAGYPAFYAVEQLVVLTGSCSPVNDRQIRWAQQNGFTTLDIQPARLIDPVTCQNESDALVERATEILGRGENLIMHSARGPGDPRVAQTLEAYRQLGLNELEIKLNNGRRLGPKLGEILQRVLLQQPCQRVGVAGGDTSGYVARALGLIALEAIAPLAPGSPLCRAHANNELDGIEFMFKGGQVGREDVWGTMLRGTQ
ncbi:MAG: four-carbon acid sugar kinase family protein [Pirellulaceae bacterium]|nr:four-carbon acid sugar kinase family protein [Pirellulaceae bacterium]